MGCLPVFCITKSRLTVGEAEMPEPQPHPGGRENVDAGPFFPYTEADEGDYSVNAVWIGLVSLV